MNTASFFDWLRDAVHERRTILRQKDQTEFLILVSPIPQTLKIRKSTIILTLFTLYGINYFVFERVLFFNEALSLLGFVYFVKYTFRPGLKVFVPHNLVYKCVLFFLLLGSFHAIVGLFIKTTWYYYFRNLSMVYSVFTFFLGFYLYEAQYHFYSKIRRAIYGFGFLSMVYGQLGFIDRNAFAYWLVLLQKKWKLISLFLLSLFLLFYFARFTSLTVFIILIAILVIVSLNRYWKFKWLVIAGVSAFAILFLLAVPYLQLYSINKELFFGDVEYVYNQHPWFHYDHNTGWRMIFWYRVIFELFPYNLVGIGLGTPLLPYLPGVTTTDLGHSDEYIAHVIGVHNTFITIFARLGIVSMALFLLTYRKIFREFYYFKSYYLTHRNDFSIFMAFFVLTIVGQFNLLIESVTLSSVFWFSLGTVSHAIYQRQFGTIDQPSDQPTTHAKVQT